MAETEPEKKPSGKLLTLFILLGIAALMYVSFVYKVVKFGP